MVNNHNQVSDSKGASAPFFIRNIPCINICMEQKKITLGNRLVSYRTAVRGNWVIKASNYNDEQVVVIGYNKISSHFFTRVFTDFKEVVDFIEFVTFNQLPTLDGEEFPEFPDPKNDL